MMTLGLVALGFLLTGAGDASAAQPTRQSSIYVWSDGSGAYLELFSPDKSGSTGACIYIGDERGCADVAATFTLAADLSAASMSTTTFNLERYECTEAKDCNLIPTRQVTVEATWSGIGEAETVRGRSVDHQNGCTTVEVHRGTVRQTTTVVTVDGEQLAGAGELQAHETMTERTCG